MTWMLWAWLAAAFFVSLVAAAASGVRGAIASFVMGAVIAVAPEVVDLVGRYHAGAPAVTSFEIGAAGFRAVYWWMMAFPAAAIGIAIRSRFLRRRRAKDAS